MSSPVFHLRAPLLWLLVPLMAGLTIARFWPPPAAGLVPLAGFAAAAALVAGAAALWRRPWAYGVWAVAVCVAGGLGGFVLLHARQPAQPDEGTRPPREVTVTIRVRQTFPTAPEARSLTGLAEITATGEAERELLGRRIYYSAIRRISVPPQRSGGYVLRGVIEPLPAPVAGSDFNDYLANLGIHQRITRAHLISETAAPRRFQRFCTRAADRLEAILRHGLAGQPQTASIYLAMLLGEKAVLSAEQENAFMRSGTFHIFSISGLHVAAIAGAIALTLTLLRVPQRPAVAISLAVLWLYVQITGASAPAVRAFLMITFLLGSRVFRLPGNPLAALAAAALVTLLHDPRQLFSTGFQMSYTVVVALVTMGRPLSEKWLTAWRPFAMLPPADWRWHQRAAEWSGRKLLFAGAACWTAFLASGPSSIGYFQLFSPGSLLANLVILPLSTVTLGAGFVSLVCGLAGLLPLSALANAVAALTIVVMDWLLRHGTAAPGMWFDAQFRAEWLTPVALGLMTAVFIAGVAGRWAPRYGGYWPPVVVLAVLLLLGTTFGP
jgi:competence protein ComEC